MQEDQLDMSLKILIPPPPPRDYHRERHFRGKTMKKIHTQNRTIWRKDISPISLCAESKQDNWVRKHFSHQSLRRKSTHSKQDN